MPAQQLTISIDAIGAQRLQASGQSIAICQVTDIAPTAGSTMLAWQIVPPRLLNQLGWDEIYYLFAAQTTLAPGATLAPAAQSFIPSTPGVRATLSSNGYIVEGPKAGNPNAYILSNESGQTYSCGLVQPALVNAVLSFAPAAVASLLNANQLEVFPPPNLLVFLTSFRGNGTMLVYTGNPVLALPIVRDAPVPMTIAFNDATQGFYRVPG